jgi:hypothetical protein
LCRTHDSSHRFELCIFLFVRRIVKMRTKSMTPHSEFAHSFEFSRSSCHAFLAKRIGSNKVLVWHDRSTIEQKPSSVLSAKLRARIHSCAVGVATLQQRERERERDRESESDTKLSLYCAAPDTSAMASISTSPLRGRPATAADEQHRERTYKQKTAQQQQQHSQYRRRTTEAASMVGW